MEPGDWPPHMFDLVAVCVRQHTWPMRDEGTCQGLAALGLEAVARVAGGSPLELALTGLNPERASVLTSAALEVGAVCQRKVTSTSRLTVPAYVGNRLCR